MDVFRLLDASPVVASFDVLDHGTWHTGFYTRLYVRLSDGSGLHVKEFVNENDRKYSFHWQTPDGQMRSRWDNSPHHEDVVTHPDHRHVEERVEPSAEISLDDVLKYIECVLMEGSREKSLPTDIGQITER